MAKHIKPEIIEKIKKEKEFIETQIPLYLPIPEISHKESKQEKEKKESRVFTIDLI